MPHVVINGTIDMEALFSRLHPIFTKTPTGILKTTDLYLSREGTSILIDSLAIEEGKKQPFFTLLNQRDDGVVVRIYPGSTVEKTDGVKQILVMLANQIVALFPSSEYGKTNLTEYLSLTINQ